MAISKLIPGFRFHPTSVELVKYFLKRKVLGKKFHHDVIAELDIYKYAPWDLPDKSFLNNGDLEWYFFCPIEKKYGSGVRLNRATEIGYWKATGKDRVVQHNNHTVGMIKTLIFHTGKAPRGDRTDWVMHEYRLDDKDLVDRGIVQDSYVICKVFQKEGPGPRNGAQYGRPFIEEDWSDDEVGIPFADSAANVPSLLVASNNSALNDQNLNATGYNGSIYMPCQSGLMPFNDPANSCQTGFMPSPYPANSCQSGLVPSPDPVNSCQTGLMPSPDPANSCQTGLVHSPDPASSCQTGLMPSDPANSCQTGLMPSPDPANSCQSGLMPSPDPANSCQTGLIPSPNPAEQSYADKQAADNDDDILSMLDIFKDSDILPEENIAEGALSSDFFEGLGDLNYSATLGSFAQNAELGTNGTTTLGVVGHGDMDFVELIDLESELFWQSTTQP